MSYPGLKKICRSVISIALLGCLFIICTGCATTRDADGQRIFPEKFAASARPLTPEDTLELDQLTASYDNIVSLLRDLVQIDSVNPGIDVFSGRREIFYFAEAYLSSRGLDTHLIPVEGKDGTLYNLVAVLEGTAPGKTLLFCGHLDTVPYDKTRWDSDTPPLGAVIQDGKLIGRGAYDMKGGVAVMMETMVRLADLGAPFSGKLMLLLTPDEETGGAYGSGIITELYPELMEAGMTMIAEPTQISPLSSPAIIIGEKSPVWIRLTFFGESGHSSAPRPGASALDKAVRFISSIDRFTFPAANNETPVPRFTREVLQRFTLWNALGLYASTESGSSSVLTDSTLSFTSIQSGSKSFNQLPGTAEVLVDARLMPGISVDEFLSALTEYADTLGYPMEIQENYEGVRKETEILAEVVLSLEGNLEDIDTSEAQLLFEAFSAVYQTAPVRLISPGFTDASNLRAAGMENIFVVGPAGDHAHGVHEYVKLDSLYRLMQLYFLTALRYLN